MEVFIKDEEMPKNCGECPCANYSAYRDVLWCDLTGNELEDSAIKEKEAKPFCPLKSIDQHDLEIMADERKKVCEELEEYIREQKNREIKDWGCVGDYNDFSLIEQKLTELKE